MSLLLAKRERSIHDEHRKFQDNWTDEFLFVLHGTNPLCLICHKTCSGFKRCNLECHFQTMHTKFNDTFPPGSNIRKNKIEQLTALLGEQQKLMHRTNSMSEHLTEATSEIVWILARAKKTFYDAEIVKDFLALAESLYADFSNKDAIIKQLKVLQLSDSTIMRRVEDIGKIISNQLIADLSAASCFSITLDESALCVGQLPKDDSFREEMLCLLPLLGQTRDEDILSALLKFFNENKLNWSEISHFVGFHCIIHQEVLDNKGKSEPELRNPEWILKLALLTDITLGLNTLNLRIQGREKHPGNTLLVVEAFQKNNHKIVRT
ncbi:GT2D2 protein, partial [Atractosteus spatula]|nr:GT2D2 protein [Atractosteus spatula]